MIKFFKKILNRKPRSILLDNTFRIIPAFTWKGITYYMHEDPLNTATGRGLSGLVHMEELLMRCNVAYLKSHTEAIDKILSDKTINVSSIATIARLNQNLKERINFLVAVPEHVTRLASVVFFTKEESPFVYEMEFNKKKIEDWNKDPNIYDFFLQQTQLKDMLPFLSLPQENFQTYSAIQHKIDIMHLKELREILSKNPLKTAS
jgi:hypothetical protein